MSEPPVLKCGRTGCDQDAIAFVTATLSGYGGPGSDATVAGSTCLDHFDDTLEELRVTVRTAYDTDSPLARQVADMAETVREIRDARAAYKPPNDPANS